MVKYIFFFCGIGVCLSQNSLGQYKISKEDLVKSITDSIRIKSYADGWVALDTADVYSFAVKLHVNRSKANKPSVVDSITLSDTVANHFFKDFDFFRVFDYSAILEEQDSAKIVIPFSFSIFGGKNRRQKDYHISATPDGLNGYLAKMLFLPIKKDPKKNVWGEDMKDRTWITSHTAISDYIYIGPYVSYIAIRTIKEPWSP